MDSLIEKTRKIFLKEIEDGDIGWRTARIPSLVDQVFMALVKYRVTPNESNLIRLIIACVKSIIVFEMGEINLINYTLNKLILEIKKDQKFMIRKFDQIVADKENERFATSLFDEEIYLKMLNEISAKVFPKKNIQQIINLALNC